MHFRRLVCFLLGAWIGGSLFMTMVATQNFRSVDRLLARPSAAAAEQIKEIGGPAAARTLLRYQVSEQNRWFFEAWEWLQLVVGLLLVGLLLFATDVGKFTLVTSAMMVLIVILQRVYLTPEIIGLGRIIDYVPADMATPERRQFWALHNGYSGVEALKWLLGLILTGKLLIRVRRLGNTGKDVNVVDKANHRHINR